MHSNEDGELDITKSSSLDLAPKNRHTLWSENLNSLAQTQMLPINPSLVHKEAQTTDEGVAVHIPSMFQEAGLNTVVEIHDSDTVLMRPNAAGPNACDRICSVSLLCTFF